MLKTLLQAVVAFEIEFKFVASLVWPQLPKTPAPLLVQPVQVLAEVVQVVVSPVYAFKLKVDIALVRGNEAKIPAAKCLALSWSIGVKYGLRTGP